MAPSCSTPWKAGGGYRRPERCLPNSYYNNNKKTTSVQAKIWTHGWRDTSCDFITLSVQTQ